VSHLRNLIDDPTAVLLFVGYQGEGTLGAHLQAGATHVRIEGQEREVRCQIRSISGFSAHADEHELEAWLRHFGRATSNGAPKTVYIVHGDPDAAEAFAGRVRQELGLVAHVPAHRETVRLA